MSESMWPERAELSDLGDAFVHENGAAEDSQPIVGCIGKHEVICLPWLQRDSRNRLHFGYVEPWISDRHPCDLNICAWDLLRILDAPEYARVLAAWQQRIERVRRDQGSLPEFRPMLYVGPSIATFGLTIDEARARCQTLGVRIAPEPIADVLFELWGGQPYPMGKASHALTDPRWRGQVQL